MKFPRFNLSLTGNQLILLVSAFLVACGNVTFFGKLFTVYPLTSETAAPLLSLIIALVAITAFLLALPGVGRLTKPVLVLFLLLSSLAAYFMDSYGIILNEEMLQNAVQTDAAESLDLLTGKMLLYVGLLGILPAILVSQISLRRRGWKRELLGRAILLICLILIVATTIMSFSSFYASFFREQKALRSFTNPAYFTNSVIKFTYRNIADSGPKTLLVVGADAKKIDTPQGRQLFILVVGETARADRFALNGYPRDTTPQLKAANAVSLSNYWACGTSTAVSVPCMFSLRGMDKFDTSAADYEENLLDILQRAGTKVLWLDNNSDSKGVALRVPYRSLRSAPDNPVCDTECRDEGMLMVLQDFINQQSTGDIFIVLHQMGNHGPAYFKRYPPAFEKFTPVCKSNDLSKCSKEEINNAYDNAILYTDYFLGKTIELLRKNEDRFSTGMFYLSDHGESLGENNVYLHGMPRAIAPDNQLHIPAVFWLGKGFEQTDLAALAQQRNTRYSHDHLLHTMLGVMSVQTSVYKPEMDILNPYRKP